jgi:hypothetical protein
MQNISGKSIDLPFLHLTGRDVDAVSLAPTAHGEINIKGCQTLANITLGNDVECSGMIENMVVERKFATEVYWLDFAPERE